MTTSAQLIAADADTIRAAAAAYNADYPEAAAEVAAGTPAVLLLARPVGAAGAKFSATLAAIVIAPDGGHIYAGEPVVVASGAARRDGRTSTTANARRLAPVAAALRTVQVPVLEVSR